MALRMPLSNGQLKQSNTLSQSRKLTTPAFIQMHSFSSTW
jgi:hypothetical protein